MISTPDPRSSLWCAQTGSTYDTSEEYILQSNLRSENSPPLQPGQCIIHYATSHAQMASIMANNFTE